MPSTHRHLMALLVFSCLCMLPACSDAPPSTPPPDVPGNVGFAAGPDIAVGRFLHASVALHDGRVVIAGGFVAPGQEAEKNVEVFTPSANLWGSGPNMIAGRYAHQIVLMPNDQLLVMGGQNLSGYLTSAERWEVQTPSSAWQQAPAMREPRIHFTATTLGDHVVVAGGISDIIPRSEFFEPSAQQWLPPSMPVSMGQSRSYHRAAPLQNGKLLVAGGQGQTYLDAAEIFNPVTATWSTTENMHVARAVFTLTTLRDGRVIAIGGANAGGSLNRVEIYDPASGSWTEAPAMSHARTNHEATLLTGGRRLLVTGGADDEAKPIAEAEILDIETMQWSSAGNLGAPRFWHTAHVVQSDGRVLVVGGVDGVINGVPPTVVKTEIFTPPCASNLECVSGYYCATKGICAPLDKP